MPGPKARKGRAADRSPRGYYFAVAGVTFEGRQRLIKRHCRDGDEVRLEREPDNPHSKHAVGVWVRRRAWFFHGWVQVGHVPHEDSLEISRLLRSGWVAEGSIHHVVGGGWFKSRGLRIQVELTPGEWESA